MPNNEQAREVCVDYTMVAVKALTAMHNHAATPSGPNPPATIQKKRLRFVYLSGGAAERDQTKPLWFKQDYRRIRVSNLLNPLEISVFLVSVARWLPSFAMMFITPV